MASDYLKWKYRNVQPEEKVTYTPAQRRANWWHYHKWAVALGAALALIALSLLKSALRIGVVEPDLQIACVTAAPLPEDTVSALASALSPLVPDRNGDGQVRVQVNQYAGIGADAADDTAAGYAAAARVRLIADFETCESAFFLLDDYETFQFEYDILMPGAADWSSCPAMTGLDLGAYEYTVAGEAVRGDSQSLLSGLTLARRDCSGADAGYWETVWEILTKGAKTE